MKKKLVYKIKYGYSAGEFVAVDNRQDLEKAIYAKQKGAFVQLGGVMIDGKTILRIEPHWNYYTGWYDGYEPVSGEDFKQIGRDAPREDLETMLQEVKEDVVQLMAQNKVVLIGKDRKQLPAG
jgi:hypothetical protein